MKKNAEVRTTPEGCQLRVNGAWKPSSREEIQELVDDGWVILWNRKDYRLTSQRDAQAMGTGVVRREYLN